MTQRERLDLLRYLLGDEDYARLEAAVAREPDYTGDIETWTGRAILDCIEANEDAAGLGRCEGCGKVLPFAQMSPPDDDAVRLCKACDQPERTDDA